MDHKIGKYTPKLSNGLETVLDLLIYRGIYFGKFLGAEKDERITISKMLLQVNDISLLVEQKGKEGEELIPVAEFEQTESDFTEFAEEISQMYNTRHDIEFDTHVLPLISSMFGEKEKEDDFDYGEAREKVKEETSDFVSSFSLQYNQYKKVGILVRLLPDSIGKNEVQGIVNLAKSLLWTHCILVSSEDMTPMAKRDLTMQLYKFPCEFFHLPEIQKNPLRHALVPWYRILGSRVLQHFLDKYKCTVDEFPKMIESDKVTRLLNLPRGCVVFEWPHAGFMYVPWTIRTVQATEKTDDGIVIF